MLLTIILPIVFYNTLIVVKFFVVKYLKHIIDIEQLISFVLGVYFLSNKIHICNYVFVHVYGGTYIDEPMGLTHALF